MSSKPQIACVPHGPYTLTAASLRRASGETYPSEGNAALCRCGGSKNKPFCDGSLWDAGFRDPGG